MSRDVNSILAQPYRLLRELGENLIASGSNYIVTTRDKFPGALSSLSILVYNFDENVTRTLKKINSNTELLKLLRNYDGEAEFLVRCTGLSGQFRVLRYRMEQDNLISKIESLGRPDGELSRREELLSTLCEEPSVSGANYYSSDAMSLRSVFKGIGSELILIDLKENN